MSGGRSACAFCGSRRSELREYVTGEFFIVCKECGDVGPCGIDAEDARLAWNAHVFASGDNRNHPASRHYPAGKVPAKEPSTEGR